MQRNFHSFLTPEQYIEREGHREVRAEAICPICGHGTLCRHGTYGRGITARAGAMLGILVARFLCGLCERTVSYLPSFAFAYRVVQAASFQAYLEGKLDRPDVRRWEEVLRTYRRRMLKYSREVVRVVGCGFGRAPPKPEGLWPWLREVCGGLEAATHQLVTNFKITVFRRYQCHQPAAGF
jgi:transposase-like protein